MAAQAGIPRHCRGRNTLQDDTEGRRTTAGPDLLDRGQSHYPALTTVTVRESAGSGFNTPGGINVCGICSFV